MQEWWYLGWENVFSEVSSFQRLECMQEWLYLGREKVSCLERCPDKFRSVLIESSSVCTSATILLCSSTDRVGTQQSDRHRQSREIRRF